MVLSILSGVPLQARTTGDKPVATTHGLVSLYELPPCLDKSLRVSLAAAAGEKVRARLRA
jgi:hypothetical protein